MFGPYCASIAALDVATRTLVSGEEGDREGEIARDCTAGAIGCAHGDKCRVCLKQQHARRRGKP